MILNFGFMMLSVAGRKAASRIKGIGLLAKSDGGGLPTKELGEVRLRPWGGSMRLKLFIKSIRKIDNKNNLT